MRFPAAALIFRRLGGAGSARGGRFGATTMSARVVWWALIGAGSVPACIDHRSRFDLSSSSPPAVASPRV
jgi:hypothetical protein